MSRNLRYWRHARWQNYTRYLYARDRREAKYLGCQIIQDAKNLQDIKDAKEIQDIQDVNI